MEALAINGANQTYPVLPAGYATRSIAGAAGVTLATNEGAADIIELTGAITANIVVTVPTPIFNQVVGTSGIPYTVGLSWLKFVRNSTSGAFTVTVVGPGGTGVVVPQNEALTLYSKDGINVQAISGAASSTSTAIGADFVFQPGGPSPAAATNSYQTEASLWTAINATMLVTAGPLRLAIDSSLGTATFAAPHDYQNRLQIVGNSANIVQNILNIADGALQSNIPLITDNALIIYSSATVPGIGFSAAGALQLSIFNGAALENLGAHAMMDVLAGQTLDLILGPTAGLVAAGAGNIVGLPTITSTLQSFFYGNEGFAFTKIVSGVGGGSIWVHKGDASWMNPVIGTFAGTFSQTALDLAKGMAYLAAAQPPLLPAPLAGASEDFTVQQAIGTHMSPSVTVGAGPVTVDATALNQCFKGTAGALQYNIPASFPIGRELTFSDASGGAGGNAFTLAPAASEEIGAAGLGVAVTYTQALVKTLTIKKTDATVWTVISSTTLV